jgi:hypothetical protein
LLLELGEAFFVRVFRRPHGTYLFDNLT